MPAIYLPKKAYDDLVRRGEEPGPTVIRLVAEHLSHDPAPSPKGSKP